MSGQDVRAVGRSERTDADAPGLLRRNARRLAGVAIVVPLFFAARLPTLADDERAELAGRFAFERVELIAPDLPADAARPAPRTVRAVHPDLEHIAGWISVIGAAAALEDLDGNGLPDDVVWTDPRTDEVYVGPVPGTGERYAGFVLRAPDAGYDPATTAPMGCVPFDANEDGRLDVLVSYWGRTPVLFLRRATGALAADAFRAVELVPYAGTGEPERWYTNAVTTADVDGDGHADVLVGNYFPDGCRLLDPTAEDRATMHASMSNAHNGGRNRILRFVGAAPAEDGREPHARFEDVEGALPALEGSAWTLAVGAADLDGDLLPEIYFANDFAPDLLLHNRSRAGEVELAPLRAERTLTAPKSKVLGRDSFKGMGVDFGDVDGDGRLDIYVSNITTEYGLQESQFLWRATGDPRAMAAGRAPFVDASEPLGLARSGWAWEARLVDFDNDGVPEAMQALGFLQGETNRWPELHEVAMGNDPLLSGPGAWHRFAAGDDLSGDNTNPFFVRAADGRYYDLAPDLGLDQAQNTRGIAVGDVDGDGDLDLVLANQWRASAHERNVASDPGRFLGLHLRLPAGAERATTTVRRGHPLPSDGRVAITAACRVERADGRVLVAQVDGGNGHSGERSRDLHFGLGRADGPCAVELAWRDAAGVVRRTELELEPGWHTVLLASGEVTR